MTERRPDDKDTAADFCWAAYSDPEGVYADLYARDIYPVETVSEEDEWAAIFDELDALEIPA